MLRAWVGSEATWLLAAAGSPWAGAGASAASDRSGQAAATQTLSQAETWADFDLRDLVQTWVSAPAGNRGVLLAAHDSGSVEYLLRSSEYSNPSDRPKLVVTYLP